MKKKYTFIIGSIATIGGSVFAAKAQSIAFIDVETYNLPRSDTSYASQEQVLQNIGLLFLAFGLLLILTTFRECLRASRHDH